VPVPPPPTAAQLRALFDAPAPLTVGLEEEAMVLDAGTLDLAPRAPELLAAAPPGAPLTLEMPAAQIEVVTPPAASVPEAVATLAQGRRALAAAAAPLGLKVACAAVHPFAAGEGPLNQGERYTPIAAEYQFAARRQLLFSLQVHVCVRGADRALAVHNALRSYLPDVAALAAAAPYYEGRDTGLASVRPLLAALLPRQGVPPALDSWEALADGLAWARDAGAWWWELRPHRLHGTLEVRVPDVQPTLADAGAVAAVVHALVAWLAARHDAGERLPVADTWRIEQNRWSALRHGVAGTMTDLETGEVRPTADRLAALLANLAPTAARLGCAPELDAAGRLLAAGGGAAKLRALGPDLHAVVEALTERFLEGG